MYVGVDPFELERLARVFLPSSPYDTRTIIRKLNKKLNKTKELPTLIGLCPSLDRATEFCLKGETVCLYPRYISSGKRVTVYLNPDEMV